MLHIAHTWFQLRAGYVGFYFWQQLLDNWVAGSSLRVTICDTIKLNQSFVDPDQFQFSVLHLISWTPFRAWFWQKPHLNWTYHSRDITIVMLLKTVKYKRKLRAIIGFISKYIFPTNDWFSFVRWDQML